MSIDNLIDIIKNVIKAITHKLKYLWKLIQRKLIQKNKNEYLRLAIFAFLIYPFVLLIHISGFSLIKNLSYLKPTIINYLLEIFIYAVGISYFFIMTLLLFFYLNNFHDILRIIPIGLFWLPYLWMSNPKISTLAFFLVDLILSGFILYGFKKAKISALLQNSDIQSALIGAITTIIVTLIGLILKK